MKIIKRVKEHFPVGEESTGEFVYTGLHIFLFVHLFKLAFGSAESVWATVFGPTGHKEYSTKKCTRLPGAKESISRS